MGSGSPQNPVVVTAFHTLLLHQSLIAVGLLLLVMVAGRFFRARVLRQASSAGSSPAAAALVPEASARRLLRIGFGLLWLFDGILQGQSSMPLGLIPGVVQPAASSSPSWVQSLVESGSNVWSYHPVQAAVAAVWIQIGLGLWLLVAPRGVWSRLAGVASAGWGLMVWVFGEAFGGIFGQGLTWLFGAPGAALLYVVAGVLVAAPDGWWETRRTGRWLLGAMGVFFVGMALLQAWPGRGFWQGRAGFGHSEGTLSSMVGDMAGTSQPALFHSLVSWFASLDAGHAFAVNLAFVLALAAMGVLLLQPRLGLVRCGVILSAVVCLVDWILIEDLGFFGGVGTDPNSMIPTFLVVGAGYLALTRQPAHPEEPAAVPVPTPTFRQALAADPAYAFRSVAALSAMVVTLMGVVPMLIVTPNRHADPILTEAADGPVNAVDLPAGDFSLTDQHGRPVTLASLRGKVVALTFLDPVCTNDCPVVAAEFRAADRMLGADAGRVAMVAINANPVFRNAAYVQAFDAQEDLTNVSNWQFLTGGLPALSTAWKEYGILVSVEPGGGMIDHSFVSYIIDSTGQTRFELDSSPGSDTSAFTSSFAQTLAGSIERVLHC